MWEFPVVSIFISYFAISLFIGSVLAHVTVIAFEAGFKPSPNILDALVNPISSPNDKTVVAKTSGGVRLIVLTELIGKVLKKDRSFIWFNCQSCEELSLARN